MEKIFPGSLSIPFFMGDKILCLCKDGNLYSISLDNFEIKMERKLGVPSHYQIQKKGKFYGKKLSIYGIKKDFYKRYDISNLKCLSKVFEMVEVKEEFLILKGKNIFCKLSILNNK